MSKFLGVLRVPTLSAAPGSPVTGQAYFNTTAGLMYYWTGVEWLAISGNKSYTTTIGDGTATSFTVTHSFGSREVYVLVRETATPYEIIDVQVQADTTNTVIVGPFLTIPTAGQYTVTVTAVTPSVATPAGLLTAITTVSANATLDGTNHVVLVDATGAGRTITLPLASGHTGRQYVIKKKDATGNLATIGRTGSDVIDGATTYVLSTQYQAVTVISDGTNWYIA